MSTHVRSSIYIVYTGSPEQVAYILYTFSNNFSLLFSRSFDIFVNCVLEEMKNQQLECDPDVVKDRLADDYDRYLNYDEECKRKTSF